MMRLMLLRHAKSSWADSGLSDFERPLNARGRRAASLMGNYMRQRRLQPDLILCSPAQRTRQTVSGILEDLDINPPVDYPPDLYLADNGVLASLIATVDDNVQSLLCVGHNPGFQNAAVQFSVPDEVGMRDAIAKKLPAGALVVIDLEGDAWSSIGPGKLVEFQTPKALA